MDISHRHPSLTMPLIIAAVVTALVMGAGFLITADPGWSAAEQSAIGAVQSAGGIGADVAASAISALFGPVGAPLVVLIIATAGYLLTRSWQVVARAVTVLGVPWVIAEVMKEIVRRPRPGAGIDGSSVVPATFSFPSGHTAFAAAVGCAVVLVLVTGRARAIAIAAAAVIALATGWSRVYLGVHFPTDVIASTILIPVLAVAVDRLFGRIPALVLDRPRSARRDAR